MNKNIRLFKLSKLLSVVVLFTVGLPLPSFAQNQCSNLFYTLRQAALDSFRPTSVGTETSQQYMKSAESEMLSTTGNRVERKFTSSNLKIVSQLGVMTNQLVALFPDFKLFPRDKKTDGFLNITSTRYLTKLILDFQGKKLVTKIRIRKYGLAPEGETIDRLGFKPIRSMFDEKGRPISWLEFKIEHPEYENAVLKPRIKFHDQFSHLLGNQKAFLMNLENIRIETKKLNREIISGKEVNKDRLVDDMLSAVVLSLKEGASLAPISDTLYERTSFVVNLENKANGTIVNIQITLDRDIHQYSTVLASEVKTYEPGLDLSVIEVKIPVQYAALSEKDLIDVPGLSVVKNLISNLAEVQQQGYSMDKGKFSRAVEILRN